jgi:hypothetical protein
VTAPGGGDLADPHVLRLQQGDLLALGEGQMPTRRRTDPDRGHAAAFPEPPGPDRSRHPAPIAAASLVNPSAILIQNARSTSRRTGGRPGHRIAGRPVTVVTTLLAVPSTHPSSSGCCDDQLNPPCDPASE